MHHAGWSRIPSAQVGHAEWRWTVMVWPVNICFCIEDGSRNYAEMFLRTDLLVNPVNILFLSFCYFILVLIFIFKCSSDYKYETEYKSAWWERSVDPTLASPTWGRLQTVFVSYLKNAKFFKRSRSGGFLPQKRELLFWETTRCIRTARGRKEERWKDAYMLPWSPEIYLLLYSTSSLLSLFLSNRELVVMIN